MAKEKPKAEVKFLALKRVLEKKKWELDDREWEQKSMAKELAARNEVLDERETALRKREAEVTEKEVELAVKLGIDILMPEAEQEMEIDESDFLEEAEQEEKKESFLPEKNKSSELPLTDGLPKTIILDEEDDKHSRPPTSGQFQIATKARDPEFYYRVYKMLYNKRCEVKEFSPGNIDVLIDSLNLQVKKISDDIHSLGIFSEDQMGKKFNEETFHRRVVQVVLFDIKTDLISKRITIDRLLPFEEVEKILKAKFK